MKMIINGSSMIPIYEQIVEQVKSNIISGQLKDGDVLPSVRALSGELKISSLTVKKAYDCLEKEGYTVTVHGKGTYVRSANRELMFEERKRIIEEELEQVIRKGMSWGMQEEEFRTLLELLLRNG